MTGSFGKSHVLYIMVVLELRLLVFFLASRQSLYPFLAISHSGVLLLLEPVLAHVLFHSKN
jgi:hypothetical protein